MEYQSSTTLGSESTWDPYTGETSQEAENGSTSNVNWRGGYESRPWLFLGLAFTAGCAAAALIPSSDSAGYDDYSADYSDSGSSATYSRSKSSYLSETWGKMQSAFIVAATRQAENFLEELVPGFREAYGEQGQSGDHSGKSE